MYNDAPWLYDFHSFVACYEFSPLLRRPILKKLKKSEYSQLLIFLKYDEFTS